MIKRLILILLLICFFCLNSNLDKAFASASSEEMLIILDYSASMNKPLNDKTRARYVLLTLFTALSNIPDDTKIGLRVFGPDNNYQASMARDIHTNHDCKATYLKVPIASNSKHLIYARLSEYTNPFGQTPIELSLRQAIQNDFSSNAALKHIILVTDGTDTCGGNPCKYISELMKHRKDILIDVISIADKDGNYGNLACLPKYTNGHYFVVKSSDDILTSFKSTLKVSQESLKTKVNEPTFNDASEEIKYSNYLFKINY